MVLKFISKIQFVLLMLLSLSVYAAAVVVGTLVFDKTECTNAGLGNEFVGVGDIDPGNIFIENVEAFDVFRCIANDIKGTNDAKLSQVTRQTTSLISQHLSSEIGFHFSGEGAFSARAHKMAASSDINSWLPDGVWAVTSITQVSDDQGKQSDTDIYQVVGGFDKVINNFIVGSALTYAHNEDEQEKAHFTGDTVGITPYIAYKITNYLFVSTLLGYNYTHTNAVKNGSDVDTNEFISETNLNILKVIDSIILKGRAGFRYKHTHTLLENDVNGRDDDFDELTWIGDIEIAYKLSNQLRVYTGLLYEYRDQEDSAASESIHDGVGFMRYGAEYDINKVLKLGANIEHDINDEDNDFITGSLNVRLVF